MKNEEQKFAAEILNRNPVFQRLCQIYPLATAQHIMRTHTETDLRYRLGMEWLMKDNNPVVSGPLLCVLDAIREHFKG